MDRVIRWFTFGRLIAAAAIFVAGAIGTGVGILIEQGAARASFAAQFADHEKRLVGLEEHVRSQAVQNTAILTGLAELKGEVRALRREVRP